MPRLRTESARSIQRMVNVPPWLMAELYALRGASRLLGYGRLPWWRFLEAGARAIGSELRRDAERRGMSWERLELDGLAMEARTRERRRRARAGLPVDDEPSAPGTGWQTRAGVRPGIDWGDDPHAGA